MTVAERSRSEVDSRGPRRSIARVLTGAVAVALVAGLAIGGGLALWIGRLNPQLSGGETLRVALHLILLYAGLQLVGLLAAAAVGLLSGFRPGVRVFVALSAGVWVALNGMLRHISAAQALSVTPHMSVVGVLDAVCIALAAALAMLGIAARVRGRAVAALAGAAALLVSLELFHAWHERPLERDLAQALPPALAAAGPSSVPRSEQPFGNARLIVLGIDGLSWEVLLPMLSQGQLPGFRALLEGAAYGHLATHPFTKSPLIWESIATGTEPQRHGIGHHVHLEFRGIERRIPHLPYFPLTNSPWALRRLLTATAGFAPWRLVPADATDARVARFWDVAQRLGLGIGLYDWMNTTPVAPLRPFVHGHGSVPPLHFPADLEEGLPPLPTSPAPNERGLAAVEAHLPRQRATYEQFRDLALRHGPEVLLFYTHFGDAVNHWNWRDETHGPRFFISGLRHPNFEPGPAISRTMAFLDQVVADVLSRTPERAVLALVSDHGFDFRGYEHDNAPPGVLVLRGPGIRPGSFAGARIYDVAPTLLHLLGLPVARDMAGAPLDLALPGGGLDRPVAWAPSHGAPVPPLAAGTPDPEDVREYEEYLRELGYVL